MASSAEVILRPKSVSSGACPLIAQLQGGSGPPVGGAPAQLMMEKGTDGTKSKIRAITCWDGTVRWGLENNITGVKQVLAARNRLTGKVRFIEVGSTSLQPFIPRNSRTGLNIEIPTDVNLSEKFGSKKQKRYQEQSKKYKIDVSTIKEQLQDTALKMDTSAGSALDTTNPDDMIEKYIPPIDRDAANVKDVYKLDKILSAEEIDALKSCSELVINGDSETVVISDFMKKYISSIQADSSTSKIDKCIAMLYADCLLYYLTCDYKKASALNCVVCPYSEVINTSVLDNFSVRSDKSRSRPKSLKDKAVCYIIVLLLLSSNLIFSDYEELREALNITGPKMSQFVKIVGARIVSVDGVSSIVLKLPLTKAPSMNLKRGRK